MNNRDIVDALGEYVGSWTHRGWAPYLMTLMFNHLHGSWSGVFRQMEVEVERVYATYLTRVVREPLKAGSAGRLPRWIVAPDRPVPKHQKYRLQDVTINDGIHLHGIALVPPWSRMKSGMGEHFCEHLNLYVRPGGKLRHVHVEPITQRTAYVTGYALKGLTRRTFSTDDLIIMPRAASEIRDTHPYQENSTRR